MQQTVETETADGFLEGAQDKGEPQSASGQSLWYLFLLCVVVCRWCQCFVSFHDGT